jgi:hypothetical protein
VPERIKIPLVAYCPSLPSVSGLRLLEYEMVLAIRGALKSFGQRLLSINDGEEKKAEPRSDPCFECRIQGSNPCVL